MDLDTVADELYGLRPEEFVAARATHAAAARTAGDRALADRITKLRRPSLSAWASNLLVREHRSEVEPLLRLGEGLRQAHRDLDGARLRELSRRQRTLISALSRQAGQLAAQAGHPISEAARHEVEDTLRAALAQPEAAQEWASGRLTKPFSATADFPAFNENAARRRAPATPPPTEPPAPEPSPPPRRDRKTDADRRRRLAQARKDADETVRELRAREDEAASATREADAARKHLDEVERRISELAAELQRAKDEQRQTRSAEQAARDQVRMAERQVREARRRAAAAAADVERLT
ncbi:hypothetical protein QQM39_25755 [Streptomyces sp. DT2A-34]|uniref:hypothetical protein n=1 Tax=Streptomyces sp. DT2A-34 TaxID=3051182 RepID=UPI00265BEBEB|nr:hypothetical protein [Streptomyces sp. DT2A-34]MDO0914112.1 hypothetical protein [Streptomyces sp. DT2A-34]